MTAPTKLIVDHSGRLRDPSGKANITYNDPWPMKYAAPGKTGAMQGALLHTMDGSLSSCINTFNSPSARGSAHAGISQAGRIHQFVPFGQGFETYHAYAANLTFYGIETEDQGDLEHHAHVDPISDAGLWSWAQVFECLSNFAGFPCQVLVNQGGRGLGYHRQFPLWNLSNHACPGASFADMTRVNQRAEIVRRAKLIRAGVVQPVPRTPGHVAYAAHGDYLNWGDGGTRIPFWSSIGVVEKNAWEAAAKAVLP